MNLGLYIAIDRIGLGLAVTLVLLGQTLDLHEWAGMAVVVGANAVALTPRRRRDQGRSGGPTRAAAWPAREADPRVGACASRGRTCRRAGSCGTA
jgi:hypothetical protein